MTYFPFALYIPVFPIYPCTPYTPSLSGKGDKGEKGEVLRAHARGREHGIRTHRAREGSHAMTPSRSMKTCLGAAQRRDGRWPFYARRRHPRVIKGTMPITPRGEQGGGTKTKRCNRTTS